MTHQNEAGVIRTDLVAAVLLTALVLGVGLYLGAAHYTAPAAPPQPSGEPVPITPPHEAASPTLLAVPPSSNFESRLAAVERAVSELRASLATAMDRLRPALEDYEKLMRGGGILPPGVPPEILATPGDTATDEVRKISRTLGLDASRREAMAAQFAQALAAIEALEKAHAEVSRDGSVTTIKIGKYGDQASSSLQRWRDWIDRSLTPQEKEAYERDHSEARLLGMRTGLFERTVRLDETGGAIQVTESIATRDGPQQVLQASAPAAARDLILEPYSHLLPGAPGR